MENLVIKNLLQNFGKRLSMEKLFNQLKESMVPSIRKELKGEFVVKDSSQLSLGEYSQPGRGEERDGKIYPFVRLDVHVTSLDGTKTADFVYSIGIFDCNLFVLGEEFSDYGIKDMSVTKAHRKNMREKYGEEAYNKLVASYNRRVRQNKNNENNV